MRQDPHKMEPRDYTELQLEARGMTNDMIPVSGSSVEGTVELNLKIKGARPKIVEL